MTLSLEKIMSESEMATLGVADMTDEQKRVLSNWAMEIYHMGRHVVSDIDTVKYDGRLIILDDGSRWEVEEFDTGTSDMWDFMDKVVVIDNEMYKLDDSEKVEVTQDFD